MYVLKTIFEWLIMKNIVYAKFIQWFTSEYVKYISNDLHEYFKTFSNKAPYCQDDINWGHLAELRSQGLYFGLKPINSGTISLVFKGTYKNQDIVIKTLRVGIKDKIKLAFENIIFWASILDYIPYVRNLNILKASVEIKELLISQTDLHQELENIQIYGKAFRSLKNIETISVFPEVSNSEILVITFCDGKTIYELNEEERIFALSNVAKFFIVGLLKKRLLHGDLHPGNVFFKNGKIIPIDLGVIVHISIPEVNLLQTIMKHFFRDEFKEMLEGFHTYRDVIFASEKNTDIFFQKLEASRLKGDNFTQSTISSFINDIFYILQEVKRSDLDTRSNFYKLMICMISTLGLISNIDKDGNYNEIVKSELYKIF